NSSPSRRRRDLPTEVKQSRFVFDLEAGGGLALCACLHLGKLSARSRNATKTRRTARAPTRERGEDAGRNSESLSLTLEPGSHFAQWKKDAVVYGEPAWHIWTGAQDT